MRLVIIGLLLSAAAFAQYPIPGSSGGGGGGGGCTAGTGITCVGSTISVDTAESQSEFSVSSKVKLSWNVARQVSSDQASTIAPVGPTSLKALRNSPSDGQT